MATIARTASAPASVTYLRAAAVGVLTAVVMAVPTDIIDTPWFGREVPVRWWEYPTLAAIAILTAFWFGIAAPRRRTGGAAGGIMLGTFAVGCPVCNKLVLAAVGTSGALGIWAPLQPVLAGISVALMAGLVIWRWRQRPCATGQCAATPVDRDG